MRHPITTLDEIRRLAAAYQTAREIGAMLGLTKDAVIGLCWRNAIRLRVDRRDGWRYWRERSRFNDPSPHLNAALT